MIGTEDLQYINHQAIMMVESSPRVDTWMDWPDHHRHDDPSQIPKALIPIDPTDINACSKIIVKSDKQSNNVTKHKLNYFWWTKTTQMIGRILKGIWYMVYIYSIYTRVSCCFPKRSEFSRLLQFDTQDAFFWQSQDDCGQLKNENKLMTLVLHTFITTTTTTTSTTTTTTTTTGRSSSLTFNLHPFTLQVTCPLLGDASPTNIFRNLDLPDPAGPAKATNLPGTSIRLFSPRFVGTTRHLVLCRHPKKKQNEESKRETEGRFDYIGQLNCKNIFEICKTIMKTWVNVSWCVYCHLWLMLIAIPSGKGMKSAVQVVPSFTGEADFREVSAVPKYPEKLRDWYLETAACHSLSASAGKWCMFAGSNPLGKLKTPYQWCCMWLQQTCKNCWKSYLFIPPASNVLKMSSLFGSESMTPKVTPDDINPLLEVWPFYGPNPPNIAC